ncbi:hypothetical protein [Curtanaerobium respiraculi]|uniref:hypothetical protein n=1 Tax=Curtanaerobium respiraculi TaxID=2949669 RepID=UPI0024B38FD0|nr:hypothetical protein [Curtanaerobium respiraculi]
MMSEEQQQSDQEQQSPTEAPQGNHGGAPEPPRDWRPGLSGQDAGNDDASNTPRPMQHPVSGGGGESGWQGFPWGGGMPDPGEVPTPFKLGWGLIGFLTGVFSLLFVLIGTMRKPVGVRILAFRYAIYGFLTSLVIELILIGTLGADYLNFVNNGILSTTSTGTSAGSAF